MSRCFYCGWHDDGHSLLCPELVRDRANRKAALALWQAGYEEGRDGATAPSKNDPIFELGFLQGEAQCEYMTNVSRYDYYPE